MAEPLTVDPEVLPELLSWHMPFGKYAGRRLVDLPLPYLEWFAREGFPRGKLGAFMALAFEIKHQGLEHLLKPLAVGR